MPVCRYSLWTARSLIVFALTLLQIDNSRHISEPALFQGSPRLSRYRWTAASQLLNVVLTPCHYFLFEVAEAISVLHLHLHIPVH